METILYYYDNNGYYYAAANQYLAGFVQQYGGGITLLKPPYMALNNYKKSYFDGQKWQLKDLKAEAATSYEQLSRKVEPGLLRGGNTIINDELARLKAIIEADD
ncbi:MAG: hypothetical protein FWE37_03045 [Spirochaetaceae bacterium]|nr:hypothetical protein [Spirochaetaceae bacterium]